MRKFDKFLAESSLQLSLFFSVSCPDCGIQVARWSLSRHKSRVHLKIKNFECKICFKKFFRNDELTTHLETHEEKVKSLSCDLCDDKKNAFSRVESLNSHIKKVHLGKSPIVPKTESVSCSICQLTLTSQKRLDNHIKSRHSAVENEVDFSTKTNGLSEEQKEK